MKKPVFAITDRVHVKEEHDGAFAVSDVRTPPGEVVFVNDRIADVRLDDGNHSPFLLEHLEREAT